MLRRVAGLEGRQLMTDTLLAFILIVIVLIWIEHCAWLAGTRRTVRRFNARFRKVCKNSWRRISKKLRIGKYRRTL